MKNIKEDFKTIIDTAREIKAGGETAHQVIGETSISVERLLNLNKTRVIEYPDGRKETIKNETTSNEDYLGKEFIDVFFKETKAYLKMVYDNQKEERNLRKWAPFRWALSLLIFAGGVLLLQRLLSSI